MSVLSSAIRAECRGIAVQKHDRLLVDTHDHVTLSKLAAGLGDPGDCSSAPRLDDHVIRTGRERAIGRRIAVEKRDRLLVDLVEHIALLDEITR